tara:strand:- start:4 stop:330 length:327 start_codon:yes stop_codon:yes gene_type:complete
MNGKAYLRRKCNECYYQDCQSYRDNSRSQLNEIKSNKKCEVCGFDDWRALQYHHKKREEKLMNIGAAAGHGLEKIKKEIKKCQCICANCHQILHHEERERKRKPRRQQ